MSPSSSTSWQQPELKVKRAHPKSFTRPLEDAVIVPSSSTVYSAEMLSWRKRPSGSFLARAYHFPAYCHESVLISRLAIMVRLAQKCDQNAFLTPHCLINASLSLGGNVAHRSCSAAWWSLASVPEGVGLAALHSCVCVVLVTGDVPVTVIPHQKRLPS